MKVWPCIVVDLDDRSGTIEAYLNVSYYNCNILFAGGQKQRIASARAILKVSSVFFIGGLHFWFFRFESVVK